MPAVAISLLVEEIMDYCSSCTTSRVEQTAHARKAWEQCSVLLYYYACTVCLLCCDVLCFPVQCNMVRSKAYS